jgi:perosamine synthetase
MKLTSPKFDEQEINLVRDCLDSGWVTQGPMVQKFEMLFAEYHAHTYALATTSCTAALHLATMALGLGPGDEVIVPAYTWITSANCVEYVGAKVIFADIELETFNLDPLALEAAITPRTKAIVVVHLFGLAAKMDEIMSIAKRNNLQVIEDAACAIATTYNGHSVGCIGDIGCFSFHPRKIITTGEGGMVTTDDADLKDKIASLRNHGATGVGPEYVNKPYGMANFDMLGYNLRMSDIQAAIGVAQMEKLATLLDERLARAERYTRLLSVLETIALPPPSSKCGHTYQSYVIRLKDSDVELRNRVMDYMQKRQIQTRPGTHAVHRLGYYQGKYDLHPEMFPNACKGEDTTITLPIFPDMADGHQDFVVQSVHEAMNLHAP